MSKETKEQLLSNIEKLISQIEKYESVLPYFDQNGGIPYISFLALGGGFNVEQIALYPEAAKLAIKSSKLACLEAISIMQGRLNSGSNEAVLILHYTEHGKNWVVDMSDDFKLHLSQDINEAKQFANRDEIKAFLYGQPKTNFITYCFNPKTGYFGTSPKMPNNTAEKPVILLSIKDVGYFRYRTPSDPANSRPTSLNLKEAIKFENMNEVQNFWGEYPTGDIIVSYHHPKTLEQIAEKPTPPPF
jgi:hypothetical protein